MEMMLILDDNSHFTKSSVGRWLKEDRKYELELCKFLWSVIEDGEPILNDPTMMRSLGG